MSDFRHGKFGFDKNIFIWLHTRELFFECLKSYTINTLFHPSISRIITHNDSPYTAFFSIIEYSHYFNKQFSASFRQASMCSASQGRFRSAQTHDSLLNVLLKLVETFQNQHYIDQMTENCQIDEHSQYLTSKRSVKLFPNSAPANNCYGA